MQHNIHTKPEHTAGNEEPVLPQYDALLDPVKKKVDPGEFNIFSMFGWRVIILLCCAQHMTKGFCRSFVGAAWPYIMRSYKVPAPRMAIFQGVAGLPWALKPIIGVISDTMPIGGYTKMPYLLLSVAMGGVSLFVLGSMRYNLAVSSVVLLVFLFTLYVSTTDLLSEAVYAQVLRKQPKFGPSLISFIWGGMIIAGMLAGLLSGLILNTYSPWVLYQVAIIPAFLIFIPACLNWHNEPKLSEADVQVRRESIYKQKEAIALALIMFVTSVGLTWSGMCLSTKQNALVSLIAFIVVLTAFSTLLNPVIAKVNAFSLIQSSLALSTGGAGFYFMMDGPEEFPDGPHFGIKFYNMVLPQVGSICTLFGIYLFNRSASTWSYQRMYIFGNLMVSATAIFDVAFYQRWNKQIGINDHIFVLGSASFQSVIMEWLWMPGVVLLSQLCPKGMEAIMYANLAGCNNIGNTFSSNFGAALMEYLEVQPNGTKDDPAMFRNLWICSLLGSLLPLIPVVLVRWFIPNKLSTEPIFEGENVPANEGSLFRRWMGWDDEEQVAEEEARIVAAH